MSLKLPIQNPLNLVVVVAFFVCWAPFQAQRLVAIYGELNHEDHLNDSIIDVYQVLTYVSGILYYLSTTINPLLYNLMSHKFRTAFKETWRSCKGASNLSPDHSMPALDYKWQRHHSHSRSFSNSQFDEMNAMKRLMTTPKPWQPAIVTINETSANAPTDASPPPPPPPVADKSSSRFQRLTVYGKRDAVGESGATDAILDNDLTNNNGATAMLMTPN